MSDTDENITHVFDQTNGVLDGFEGESDGTSEAAVDDAAARRDGRPGDDAAPRSGGDAGTGTDRDAPEHAFAVDGGGTATDLDDRDRDTASGGGAAAASGGGAHVAATSDTTDRGSSGGSADADRSAEPRTFDEGDRDDGSARVRETADGPAGAGAGAGGTDRGDDSIAHVFDQTNGVLDGVEGESDGTAAGDEASAADRDGRIEPNPVGQQDAWRDDHYGADDGRDRNP